MKSYTVTGKLTAFDDEEMAIWVDGELYRINADGDEEAWNNIDLEKLLGKQVKIYLTDTNDLIQFIEKI